MAGTTGLEPAASAVTDWILTVLTARSSSSKELFDRAYRTQIGPNLYHSWISVTAAKPSSQYQSPLRSDCFSAIENAAKPQTVIPLKARFLTSFEFAKNKLRRWWNLHFPYVHSWCQPFVDHPKERFREGLALLCWMPSRCYLAKATRPFAGIVIEAELGIQFAFGHNQSRSPRVTGNARIFLSTK